MKHIIDALHKAASETTEFITSDIRQHTAKHGWSPEASSSAHVEYADGEFVAKVTGKHSDAAFVHEFGDETHPPTAAIRKYSSSKAENALLANAAKHIGGLL